MSIEKALAELTAAINANTEAVRELLANTGDEAPAPKTKPTKTEPAADEPKRGRGRPPKNAEAKAPAVTLEDVKAKLREHMAAFGQDATKELLAEFNAAKIDALKPAQYSEVIAQATAELEAGEGGDDDNGLDL